MSGLCLLQEMTEGLGSYPNASVWRPVPGTLEALHAELLVEIRQNQSELWSSQSPLFFPDFRHSGSIEPSQELCFSHLPSAAWGLLEQSSLQPTTASLSSPNFVHFPLLNCLGFFPPMFDWLQPSTPFELGWNTRATIFLPPCCGYSIVPLPFSLFCTFCTSLPTPYLNLFSVISLLHLFCQCLLLGQALCRNQHPSPGFSKSCLHQIHFLSKSFNWYPAAFQTSSHQAIAPCISSIISIKVISSPFQCTKSGEGL